MAKSMVCISYTNFNAWLSTDVEWWPLHGAGEIACPPYFKLFSIQWNSCWFQTSVTWCLHSSTLVNRLIDTTIMTYQKYDGKINISSFYLAELVTHSACSVLQYCVAVLATSVLKSSSIWSHCLEKGKTAHWDQVQLKCEPALRFTKMKPMKLRFM